MLHDEIKQLAEKITNGLATTAEIERFNHYCNQVQPAAGWDETLLGNQQEMAVLLRARIDTALQQQPATGKLKKLVRWTMAAAAAGLLAIAGWLFRTELRNWIDPVEMQQVATRQGERKKVSLPDGTTLWLSPVSEVQYPAEFRGDTREIALKGEAFFEVTKDAAHPFIIHADHVDTKVLGTSFTIQAYQQDQQILITVVTGKVEVLLPQNNQSTSTAVQLTPNQRAVFNKAAQSLSKEEYPNAAKQLQARRDGVFEFKGIPVAQVMEELQRQFNTPIEITGNYQDCAYYGNLKVSDGLEKFLNKFCLTINATVKRSGEGWLVNVQGCR